MITKELTITQLSDSSVKVEIQVESQTLTSIHQTKAIQAGGFEDQIILNLQLPYPATYTPYKGSDNIQCAIENYKLITSAGEEKTYETAEEAIKELADILKCNCCQGGGTPEPEPDPNTFRVRVYSPIPHWERPTEPWLLKEFTVEKGQPVNLSEEINLGDYYNDYKENDTNYTAPTFVWYGHKWIFRGWYVEDTAALNAIDKDLDITFRIDWYAYNFYRMMPDTMGVVFITENGIVDYSEGKKFHIEIETARFTRFGINSSAYQNIPYTYTPGTYATDIEDYTISGQTNNPAGCRFFSPGHEGDPNMPVIIKNIKSDIPFILVLTNAFKDDYGAGEIQIQVKGDFQRYTAGSEDKLPAAVIQTHSDKPYNFYTDYRIGTLTSEIGMMVRYKDNNGDDYIEWGEDQCKYILDQDTLTATKE